MGYLKFLNGSYILRHFEGRVELPDFYPSPNIRMMKSKRRWAWNVARTVQWTGEDKLFVGKAERKRPHG